MQVGGIWFDANGEELAMMYVTRQATCVALILASLTAIPHDVCAGGKDQILGSWKLVSLEFRKQNGEATYPLGKDAVGTIAYTPNGHFDVQVMRADRAKFSSNDFLGGTPDEKRTAFESYIAYFGHYHVHEDQGFLVHRVQGSLFPNWIGSDQKRFYEVAGNKLTLRAAPFVAGGTEITGFSIWERE
jgi:hypothetical protein